MGGAAVLVWFERRLLGFWQDRLGPNRVGPFGIGLALADIIKLLAKEDWVPPFADKFVFIFAPTAIMMAMLLGFAVLPYAPGIYIVDIDIAFAVLSRHDVSCSLQRIVGRPRLPQQVCTAGRAALCRSKWSAMKYLWVCP